MHWWLSDLPARLLLLHAWLDVLLHRLAGRRLAAALWMPSIITMRNEPYFPEFIWVLDRYEQRTCHERLFDVQLHFRSSSAEPALAIRELARLRAASTTSTATTNSSASQPRPAP